MIEQLVRTGKARFEFRHFPWHGRDSEFAALAMECAADQSGGAFWRFHDRFMANGDTTARSRTRTIDYAAEIGLDVEPFTQCLDDQTHAERIEAGLAAARRAGVRLTPTIFVNEERSGTVIDAIRRDVEAAAP